MAVGIASRPVGGKAAAVTAFEEVEKGAAELGTSVNNVHHSNTRVTKQLRKAVLRLREWKKGQ